MNKGALVAGSARRNPRDTHLRDGSLVMRDRWVIPCFYRGEAFIDIMTRLGEVKVSRRKSLV